MYKYNLQKKKILNPLQETKILQHIIIITSIITNNLKFQHKPKYIIFQKSSHKIRPIIIIT
jgi:hypothetical protein